MAEIKVEEHFYLCLSKTPVQFEPGGNLTSVFFDDSNRQVFAVRSNGTLGVVVKGPDNKTIITFRMEDKGEVISIKFSHDMKLLAVQRSNTHVEFINFREGFDTVEYSQICKAKNAKIIGFNWVTVNEIVYITDKGVEYFVINYEKKSLKLLKSHSLSINWYSWMPQRSMLITSTGQLGNMLQPFQFKGGVVSKLSKFEVDLPSVAKPPQQPLPERDVSMASLYDDLYVMVLRNQPAGENGAEIALFLVAKDTPTKKLHVLKLGMFGRFAINVIDNLVVVHHQTSKTSMIFDIQLSGDEDKGITYHHPVLSPLPIQPCTIQLPRGATGTTELNCELYSQNWIIFQPNVIIDAKLGCFWTVQLKLESTIAMIPDKVRLADFLLSRKDSKVVILTLCKQMLTPGSQADLKTISKVFDRINIVYRDYLRAETEALATDSNPYQPGVPSAWRYRPVIHGSDMYTHVFSLFTSMEGVNYKFMIAVLVEYIRSLTVYNIPVEHYLYELMISTFVQHKCFYQLHQFLQYHVLNDSKQLACLLLSLESSYPPAYQLALDMLKRLTTANEEIIEVLLSKQQLMTALRFLRSVGGSDQVSARKFLEVAQQTSDKMTFYTVFKFFEQRNSRLRGNGRFVKGEHCEGFVRHFEDLFGTEALAEA